MIAEGRLQCRWRGPATRHCGSGPHRHRTRVPREEDLWMARWDPAGPPSV